MARICFVLEVFPQLSETFILDQIAALQARGHQIHIVADTFVDPATQHVTSPLFHDLHRDGAQRWAHDGLAKAVLRCLPGRFWNSARHMFDRLSDRRLEKYDIIIAHFGPNGLRLAHSRAAGLFDTPLLCIFHGSDVGIPAHQGTLGAYGILFTQAAALLTVNVYFRDLLIAAGCPIDRIRVHHMGVTLLAQVPPLSLEAHRLRLISVCRLVEKKGLRYAIAAIAALKAARPEIAVQYDIIGDGPQLSSLQAQAAKAGLSEQIHFQGAMPHDAVKRKLAEASVFVLPSVTAGNGDVEGIPVALMEAMAAGRIALSTRHSGIPELIEDGVSGLLTDEHDSGTLADRLAWIADHPDQAATLAQAGRAAVAQGFDKTALDRNFTGLVEDLVARQPKGSTLL